MMLSILAQAAPQGGNNGGDGATEINNAISDLIGMVQTIGLTLAGLALLIMIIRVAMTIRSGGSFGEAFSGVGVLLALMVVFGVGVSIVNWMYSIGTSLA